jgi:hypothetical protein
LKRRKTDQDLHMRSFVLGAATFALAVIAFPFAAGSAQAREYPYCASGVRGAGGCTYATLEQCRAFIAGTGGSCVSNPRYTVNERAFARTPRPRR